MNQNITYPFPPFSFEMTYTIHSNRINETPTCRVGKSFGNHVCIQFRTESDTIEDFESRYTVSTHIREAWEYFADGVDIKLYPPI